VASAGPYASLHLAPDRQPHQHRTTQFFLQAGCPSCRPTNSVKALKGYLGTSNIGRNRPHPFMHAMRPIILMSHMQARSSFGSYYRKNSSEDRKENYRRTGGIPTKKGDKRPNHESQDTGAQGTRAPTTNIPSPSHSHSQIEVLFPFPRDSDSHWEFYSHDHPYFGHYSVNCDGGSVCEICS